VQSYGEGNVLQDGLSEQKYKALLLEDQFLSALGPIQVLFVDYRKDDFNEIVLYNEYSRYLVGEDTLTVGYWCPPLIWGGMWFLLRRYTHVN
jgi:hypothetical protein